jgi:hypothetical protein
MEKALAQLKTIKKNYPNVPTLPVKDKVTPGASQAVNNWIDNVKAKFPDMEALRPNPKEPKAPLTFVEEEIDFRRKIMATRDLLFKQALSLVDFYQANKQDDLATKYRDIASKQIDILQKMGESDSPAMMLLSAQLKVANAKYEDAMDDLYKIRDILKQQGKDNQDEYFNTMRRISEVYAKQNKWKNAAEYPTFIAATTGVNDGIAKRLWPEMGVFLEDCYKNGVQRPKEVKTDEPKKEEKKEEKKDEAKAGEKKDESKADEKKDDKKE